MQPCLRWVTPHADLMAVHAAQGELLASPDMASARAQVAMWELAAAHERVHALEELVCDERKTVAARRRTEDAERQQAVSEREVGTALLAARITDVW